MIDAALSAAPTGFADVSGTTRVCPPIETVRRLQPLLPVFGITRVANVTGLDCIGIPVVMVIRPNARSVSVSQGKGVDLDAAKASGLMEAIEIHHAEHILSPLLLCSHNDIRFREPVVDVAAMAMSARGAFTSNSRILWIQGADLASEEPVWVPYEAVHTDFRAPFPDGSGHFLCTSNGLASGNTFEEAVCHGLCELIERDAMALWLARGEAHRAARELDLSTVSDPVCAILLSKFSAAGVPVRVWDVTSDTGVPTFQAWAAPPHRGMRISVDGFRGHGCHPFAGVALARALTEAAQGRLTMIAGVRDDIDPGSYEERAMDDEALTSNQAAVGRADFSSVSSLSGSTPAALVDVLMARLAAIGITRTVVVDLTRPEFAIPVVRMIAPGLEGTPFARRYQPGRRAVAAAELSQ